jgi:hypothetical protein
METIKAKKTKKSKTENLLNETYVSIGVIQKNLETIDKDMQRIEERERKYKELYLQGNRKNV